MSFCRRIRKTRSDGSGCWNEARTRSSVTDVRDWPGETAGDAAEYFNPFDEEAIFAAMHRLLNDPSLRTDLARRARLRSTQFSFQETARRTADVFHTVAEEIESAKKSRAMDARLFSNK